MALWPRLIVVTVLVALEAVEMPHVFVGLLLLSAITCPDRLATPRA